VKEAIRTVAPRFCARRMVKEYAERMYSPAMQQAGTGARPQAAGIGPGLGPAAGP
jgi:glucan phosphorylase